MVQYLNAKELLILHALVIDQSGGVHGVRDVRLLESIIHKPQTVYGGVELYPDMFAKAVIFTEGLVNYHIFVDGNKRTAFAALGRFLSVNGYRLQGSMKDIEDTMVALADKSVRAEEFLIWLKNHTTALQ